MGAKGEVGGLDGGVTGVVADSGRRVMGCSGGSCQGIM